MGGFGWALGKPAGAPRHLREALGGACAPRPRPHRLPPPAWSGALGSHRDQPPPKPSLRAGPCTRRNPSTLAAGSTPKRPPAHLSTPSHLPSDPTGLSPLRPPAQQTRGAWPPGSFKPTTLAQCLLGKARPCKGPRAIEQSQNCSCSGLCPKAVPARPSVVEVSTSGWRVPSGAGVLSWAEQQSGAAMRPAPGHTRTQGGRREAFHPLLLKTG